MTSARDCRPTDRWNEFEKIFVGRESFPAEMKNLDRHAALAMTTTRHCEEAEPTKQSRFVGKGLPTYGTLK